MNRLHSPLRRIATPGAFALALLAMAGCSKKLNTVDPNFIAPEGLRAADAHQVVQLDMPVEVARIKLHSASHPDDPDTVVSVDDVYPVGREVVRGMIVDGTAAGSYQVLRRESNGGYAPLFDYPLGPAQRFPQSGWKLYTWWDGSPSGFLPATYLGRGIVNGTITRTSPLTNVAMTGSAEPYEILLDSDSLKTISFSRVPGAVAYLLQVYTARNGYPDAAIWNAAPAALATSDHRDALVEWIPATDGNPDLDHVQILTWFGLVPASGYYIRMSAVDENGQLVGFSYGPLGELDGPEEGYYRLFRAGVIGDFVATFWEHGRGLPALTVTAPAQHHTRPQLTRSNVQVTFGRSGR